MSSLFEMDSADSDLFNDTDNEIELKFTNETENLHKDINSLDFQISSIQKHVIVLESTLTAIEQALNNPANKTNPNFDRGRYYGILNKTLEILALYHSNLQRFLDLKFKYRKEQDEFKFKIVRLINIELAQFSKSNTSNNEILEMLKKFNFSDQSSTNKLASEIEKLSENPLYDL